MNSNDQQSIRDRVLDTIEQNKVHMRPRIYFALKITGVLILAALVFLITVFIGNFLFFMLRLNGHVSLLSLGTRGWIIFLRVFPWWLLAVDVALCAALAWLLRQFQFGYRKPALFLFGGFVALALLAGFVIDTRTPLNDLLLHDADRGALPGPIDSVYKGARRPPPSGSAYRGTVIAVQHDSILITDPDMDSVLTVLLPPPNHRRPITVGDAVLIVGEEHNGVIQAFDIQPISSAGLPPSREHDDDDQSPI